MHFHVFLCFREKNQIDELCFYVIKCYKTRSSKKKQNPTTVVRCVIFHFIIHNVLFPDSTAKQKIHAPTNPTPPIDGLGDELVRDGCQTDGRRRVAQNDSAARLLGLALQRHPFALGLGVLQLQLVLLDTAQEVLAALAVLHVLDAHVDALGQDLSAHALVDNDADSVRGDVVDATGLAVVRLVGHALLDGTVALRKRNECKRTAG